MWVSTDDEEIAQVAREWKANVHWRDPQTATDVSTTESAMLDFLHTHSCDVLCLIQATSPLTLPKHFSEAFQKFEESKADSLVTVTREHLFLWSGAGKPLKYHPAQRPRHQDWDGVLVGNGAFYFTKVSVFMQEQHRLGGDSVVYEIPQEYSADIDTTDDLRHCELSLRKRETGTSPPWSAH